MEVEKEILELMRRVGDLENRPCPPAEADEITALRIQVAELESRLAELERPRPIVPKWEDLGHRHTEDEFN